VIGPPTISPRVKGMVVILSPACSVPLLEMNMPVLTLEMRNGEATVGTAETRANTEARIKNTDEKVNLTMMIKMTLVVVEGRRVPKDFIPMVVT